MEDEEPSDAFLYFMKANTKEIIDRIKHTWNNKRGRLKWKKKRMKQVIGHSEE